MRRQPRRGRKTLGAATEPGESSVGFMNNQGFYQRPSAKSELPQGPNGMTNLCPGFQMTPEFRVWATLLDSSMQIRKRSLIHVSVTNKKEMAEPQDLARQNGIKGPFANTRSEKADLMKI